MHYFRALIKSFEFINVNYFWLSPFLRDSGCWARSLKADHPDSRKFRKYKEKRGGKEEAVCVKFYFIYY